MATPASHTPYGYWLAEAGEIEARPPLEGEVEADVCVVGGGYLGMWTAWFARQAEPGARVVLLESDRCGHGPSGRNGGICNPLWSQMPWLRERFGDEAALAVGRAGADAVVGVGEWCRSQGVDAWYEEHDLIEVSTAASQDDRWLPATEACRELGVGDRYRPASAEEIASRFRSGRVRGGAILSPSATVQPARLALGLRRVLLDAGVVIHEGSPARSAREHGGNVVLDTVGGSVRALVCVLAVNAALAGWRGFSRRLSVASSHMVVTEPVPEVYEAHGWDGGPVSDHQTLLHYFRGTPDRRIALGWGGGPMGFGGRARGSLAVDRFSVDRAIAGLVDYFPEVSDRRITHAWGGPIDVSPVHLPIFGRHGRTCFGYGFTGNGVGPSHLGGRILADLALERRSELTELAIVDPPGLTRFPPEPLRYLGASAIRRALIRSDRAEEHGKRPGAFTSFVAGLPRRLKLNLPR